MVFRNGICPVKSADLGYRVRSIGRLKADEHTSGCPLVSTQFHLQEKFSVAETRRSSCHSNWWTTITVRRAKVFRQMLCKLPFSINGRPLFYANPVRIKFCYTHDQIHPSLS